MTACGPESASRPLRWFRGMRLYVACAADGTTRQQP